MIRLRSYQSAAIEAVYTALREQDGSPLIVLPTGAGKSAVIASICRDAVELWQGRVLVLTHVRELLEQLHATLHALWPTPLGRAPVGVYSAGLKRRDTEDPVIVAGIQSVYTKAAILGHFDLVIVDECHLCPPDGDGMYRSLLADLTEINPRIRLIGLTATPYRMTTGLLYGPDQIFACVAYDAPVRQLIDEGYLSSLRGKNGGDPNLAGVHKRGGEYIPAELEQAMDDAGKVAAAVMEIAHHGADRKAWLVFCCGVAHAQHVCSAIQGLGIDARMITGDTPGDERDAAIAAFKAQELRCLVNVNVLTTGFDAPHVDLIALLRPTCSPGLYYQMVGRGLRKSPGKSDCMILDMGGNIARHGPIDAMRIAPKPGDGEAGEAPVKTCPQCAEIIPAASRTCSGCGYEYPAPIVKHEAVAATDAPLVTYTETWLPVLDVFWGVHTKKGADLTAPKTLRVEYRYGMRTISEYVCVEHQGYARGKAEAWWREHTGQSEPPASAQACAAILDQLSAGKRLFLPCRVLIREGGPWPELLRKEYRQPGDDDLEPAPVASTYAPDDEVPF